jgi:hypothetical protein
MMCSDRARWFYLSYVTAAGPGRFFLQIGLKIDTRILMTRVSHLGKISRSSGFGFGSLSVRLATFLDYRRGSRWMYISQRTCFESFFGEPPLILWSGSVQCASTNESLLAKKWQWFEPGLCSDWIVPYPRRSGGRPITSIHEV